MTYGEEVLEELRKLIPVDSYLRAEQQDELRRVESSTDLKEFLANHKLPSIALPAEIPKVARNLASDMRLDRAWVGKDTGCEGCLFGCLFAPFTFQIVWLIDAFRMGRLRFSLAEALAFVTLFAVCLSYEVSIAPVYLGMPQQLYLALPAVLLFGAFPSYFFKNAAWLCVSLDLIVFMEFVAFVMWWRAGCVVAV